MLVNYKLFQQCVLGLIHLIINNDVSRKKVNKSNTQLAKLSVEEKNLGIHFLQLA